MGYRCGRDDKSGGLDVGILDVVVEVCNDVGSGVLCNTCSRILYENLGRGRCGEGDFSGVGLLCWWC